MGGIAGSEPVAITSRSYSSSRSPTSTTPGRVTTASPRTSSQRCPASHSTCEESSRSATRSRHANTPAGSSVPGSSPGARRASATSSGARSIVFVGMQAQ